MRKIPFRRPSTPSARSIVCDRLEDRLLYDAASLVDPSFDIQPVDADALAPQQCRHCEPNERVSDARLRVVSASEIVFLDSNVERLDLLLEDLQRQGIETHVLSNASDGLIQIADLLEGRQDVDGIHILSHGNRSQLLLGDAVIKADDLPGKYAKALAQIGLALSENGDLLIYGCNLAGSAAGQAMVSQLSALTGADVAASADATGHAALGGDWELEFATGAIDVFVPFSAEVRDAFQATLAQEFYVPMTEAGIYEALEDIFRRSGLWPRANGYCHDRGNHRDARWNHHHVGPP